MNTEYQDYTVKQWVELLQSGNVPERCAAALALAEAPPQLESANSGLHRALYDPASSVQEAARVALGLVGVQAEHRRKMIDQLLSGDEWTQSEVLNSLAWLCSADAAFQSPSAPNSDAETSGPTSKLLTELPPLDEPDIALVHLLPWWLVAGGIAFFLLMSWLLRGVWWSKWMLAAIFVAAALFLHFAHSRDGVSSYLRRRFLARRRFATSAMFASACGFAICFFFPLRTVFVDNESGIDVRLLLDDNYWLSIRSGETKTRHLGEGQHRLTVQTNDGSRILEVHDLEVTSHPRFVLNVLGAQVYFHGEVIYGGGAPPPAKESTERWFPLPEVDYLFEIPPRHMNVRQHAIRKSYLTKGVLP